MKVIHRPNEEERLIQIDFVKHNTAYTISHTMIPSLKQLQGEKTFLDLAGIIRGQQGKCVSGRYNRTMQPDREKETQEMQK